MSSPDQSLVEGSSMESTALVDPQSLDPSSWPEEESMLPGFGFHVTKALTEKGWCLVQLPADEDGRQGAISQAQQLRYQAPKKEFAPDLVGYEGKGKISHLDPDSQDFLSAYDDKITKLAAVMQPFTLQSMGFAVNRTTGGMIWKPFENRKEEDKMKPEPLSEEDVEEGIVQFHLNFIQQRRLCCLCTLDVDGGSLSMYSKGKNDLVERSVTIKMSSNQLLVFRADKMLYEFHPEGEFTIYQAWMMDDPPECDMKGVLSNPADKARLRGLVKGLGTPLGDRIMIQSLHCAIGGSTNSATDCWNMFAAGTDGMVYVPHTRFDTDLYFAREGEAFKPGITSYHVHGGMIDDERLFHFDNDFFNISDYDAHFINPKQRLFLETGYVCLSNAGYTKKALNGRAISVYVGDCGGQWLMICGGLLGDRGEKMSATCYGAAADVVNSNRLSHIFGLTGPALNVDTACSSGLIAFATAAKSLRPPEATQFKDFSARVRLEGSLSGGNMTNTSPMCWIANSAGSMLTHEGRCFTFNESADGYARGEGCSLLYSELITDEAAKDKSLACLIGSCANQDGRSATLTAPNGPAQTACTKASIKEGGITSGEVNASECHGTGTALGDPIEVGALIAVHGGDRANGSAFVMTSTKSNVGHGEDNAGSAGLFKCILMARHATGTSNCHLRCMNSNLVHAGFPALFTTDSIGTQLNSAITGVSSFGFGGANGHAELWAQSNDVAEEAHKMPMLSYDQLTVTCPITMGQIDYLTGEPAIDFEVKGPRKARADVIRQPLADYGISKHVYMNGFRFRLEDEEDEDEEDPRLPPGTSISVCGSWNGWTEMEEMRLMDSGAFTASVILGETRCESFYLCVNGDNEDRLYPAENNATPCIFVEGPNDRGADKRWLIDGRDEKVPAGTEYKIFFKPGGVKKVWWEARAEPTSEPRPFEHIYSVAGSWNNYQLHDLTKTAPGRWEGRIKIAETGTELFHFVRDRDMQQQIYPSEANATSTSIAVRGPDEWGSGKYWMIAGDVDEVVPFSIEVNDGHIQVKVRSQVWESVEGWDRHTYFMRSAVTPSLVQMKMDQPGIFKCQSTINEVQGYDGLIELFQIVVDADPTHCFYPAMNYASSGAYITCRPDGLEHEEHWLIRSLLPGAQFEVVLDLTAVDRRKMVTWKLL